MSYCSGPGDDLGLFCIVELRSYITQQEKIWSEENNDEFKEFIAANPTKGTILAGTGGVRKIRFGHDTRGKSGGVRIIYYLLVREELIFLILIYSKSRKETLTRSQAAEIKKLVAVLETYGEECER